MFAKLLFARNAAGTCWASAVHPPGIRRVSAVPAQCWGDAGALMSANAFIYKEFCRYLLGIRRVSARHLAVVCGTCAMLGRLWSTDVRKCYDLQGILPVPGAVGITLGRRWGEAEVCWGRLRIYKEENPEAELREKSYLSIFEDF